MKHKSWLFFLYINGIIPLVHAKLILPPVRIAADKIVIGYCVTLCNREKNKLLQEYQKVQMKDFILGRLPKSYKDAEYNYSLCLRNKCKDRWGRYFIAGVIISSILAELAIISGGAIYESFVNQKLQRQVFELYQKRNAAYPLSEADKNLISKFFSTSQERKLSLLENKKDNLPFLYIVIALLQADPIAFIQTHSLTNRRWIDELQRKYGISIEAREFYKEKQD